MTESNSDDEIQKLLSKLGCEEGKEYRLTFTKELKIEPVVPSQSIDICFPYPLPESGSCSICNQDFKTHSYLEFFVNPKHVKTIRDYVIFLIDKHKRSKVMYQRLGVEAPDTVLCPKDMSLLLIEKAETNPQLVNWMLNVYAYLTPSQQEQFESQVGISAKLEEIRNHYEGFSRKWRVELLIHPHKVMLEVAEAHEQDVKIDYENIQADFHRVTANVFAYQKQADEFGKALSPLRMAVSESIRKRRERATMPFSLLVPRSGKKSARPQQQQQSQKEW